MITVVIVICITTTIHFIRRIKLNAIQQEERQSIHVRLKQKHFNFKRLRQIDELETNLLRDPDEQDSTSESVQQEFGTESQITDAEDESRMSEQETKRIIAQLQQDISRYQTDNRQLQQELAHYKQQYQLEQQQKNICQNELEMLRKANAQATNIQQEQRLQLLSETNLLRDEKQQNDLTVQEKLVTQSQVTDAEEESRMSPQDFSKRQAELFRRELKRTSTQLQQEVSGRQNDKRKSQQKLVYYKKQCKFFKKQYQTEQLLRNTCKNELKKLGKENAQAISALQEKHSQLLSEIDALNTQLSETREHLQREKQEALEEQHQLLNAIIHQREKQIQRLLWEAKWNNQILSAGAVMNVPPRKVRHGAMSLVTQKHYDINQKVIMTQVYCREDNAPGSTGTEIVVMAKTKYHNLLGFIAADFDERLEIPLPIPQSFHVCLRDAYGGSIIFGIQQQRVMNLFCDIANAIDHLQSLHMPIIHCDVSGPNILLESLPGDMWRAKLSDFGTTKLVVETVESAAPQMFGSSAPMPHQTIKSDDIVFNYGMILIEVITQSIPTMENYHQMLEDVKTKWPFMHELVSQCTKTLPEAHLTMSDILDTLNNIPLQLEHPCLPQVRLEQSAMHSHAIYNSNEVVGTR